MALASNEMVIRLTDDTSDNRFSQTNTANDIVKAATETKTQQATKGASTPQGAGDVLKAVGGEIFKSTEAGKLVAQAKKTGAAFATPTTIALLALSLTTKLYKEWDNYRKRQIEWQNTVAIQSGANWQNVNMRNMRTGLITGKIYGERQRYRR